MLCLFRMSKSGMSITGLGTDVSSGPKLTVWFEPTEVRKARKLLQVPREFWSSLTYISPNLRELESLTQTIVSGAGQLNENDGVPRLRPTSPDAGVQDAKSRPDHMNLQSIFSQCFTRFRGLELILLTKGSQGFTVSYTQTYIYISNIHHPHSPCKHELYIKNILKQYFFIGCVS